MRNRGTCQWNVHHARLCDGGTRPHSIWHCFAFAKPCADPPLTIANDHHGVERKVPAALDYLRNASYLYDVLYEVGSFIIPA
jgi:hypothetical protein